MKIVREVYDFITGGSIAAPIGLICAIVLALLLPEESWRPFAFAAALGLTLVASTFEKPT